MTVQGTPDWLAERREYVGASEVAAIVGSDPFKGEFELAQEKRGAGEARDSWPMRFGNHVQRIGTAVYAEMTGHKVRNVTTTTRHPRWPHVRASLDGRVVGKPIGVEVKWTSRTVHEPLEHWVVQTQVQMTICGLAAVDIIRLSGRDEPAIWTIERDEALGEQLADMAEQWWLRFVQGDDMPPLDGSRAARAFLDTLRGTETTQATAVQAELVGHLHALRVSAKAIEAQDRQVVNDLKASMAGYGRLEGAGFRIDWIARKGRTTTDWRAVAAAYRAVIEGRLTGDVDLDALASLHTATDKPGTTFRPTWSDDREQEEEDES